MDKQVISSLLDVAYRLNKKEKSLETVLDTDLNFLCEEVSSIFKAILKNVGIPDENSHELTEKYQKENPHMDRHEIHLNVMGDETLFVHDEFDDEFFNFLNDEMSKDELIESIGSWVEMYAVEKNAEE
ncbi:hypothetical protein [Aneurinibacillus sp. REN35]|uniref:hypothetical protein n=1 Tax=Aneurinibacillus sp. REN35 TaxID=3237286 RepID=UPI003527DEF0